MNSTKSACLKRHNSRWLEKNGILSAKTGIMNMTREYLMADAFPLEVNALTRKETVYLDDILIEEIKWSKWEFIRVYHLIEITIAIAMGVYLWLK